MFLSKLNSKYKAIAAYQRQDYLSAIKYSQKALRKTPQDIELLLLIGNTYYMQQKYSEAAKYYQQIINLQPDNYQAIINCAEAFLWQHKYSDILPYISALKDDYYADFLSAKISFEKEDFIAAEQYLQTALNKHQNNAWVWNLLSQVAQKNTHYTLALEAGFQAVERGGGDVAHQLNLAYCIYEIGSEKGADFVVSILQKWYQKYPQSAIAQQCYFSFFPNPKFCKSNLQYVRDVFDNFADSFEQTLSDLSYQVPQEIGKEIRKVYPSNYHQKIRILDIGCGTGLCAPIIDSIFPKYHLDGVDISSQMLVFAEQKHIYKKLINADVEEYFSRCCNAYNLCVAADVFTYFGDLKKVFFGVANSLKKDGVFKFSITKLDSQISDWQQHISGRFLHTKKYIKKELSENGFSNIKFTSTILRTEGKKNVQGWIVSAIKK